MSLVQEISNVIDLSQHDAFVEQAKFSFKGNFSPQVKHPFQDNFSPQVKHPFQDKFSQQVKHSFQDKFSPQVKYPFQDNFSPQVKHPFQAKFSPQVKHPFQDKFSPQVKHPFQDNFSQVKNPFHDNFSQQAKYSLEANCFERSQLPRYKLRRQHDPQLINSIIDTVIQKAGSGELTKQITYSHSDSQPVADKLLSYKDERCEHQGESFQKLIAFYIQTLLNDSEVQNNTLCLSFFQHLHQLFIAEEDQGHDEAILNESSVDKQELPLDYSLKGHSTDRVLDGNHQKEEPATSLFPNCFHSDAINNNYMYISHNESFRRENVVKQLLNHSPHAPPVAQADDDQDTCSNSPEMLIYHSSPSAKFCKKRILDTKNLSTKKKFINSANYTNPSFSAISVCSSVNEMLMPIVSNKQFECSICHKTLVSQICLQKHINLVHYRTVQIPCTYCPKVFFRLDNYRAHVHRIHARVNSKKPSQSMEQSRDSNAH